MKIKKSKSLLYIFSSVMVLGLSLVSFNTTKPTNTKDSTQVDSTPTPIGVTHTPTLTNTPTPTPTLTPTPIPTPSATQLNTLIEIQPAEDDLTKQITSHLKEKYLDSNSNIKQLSNITCYYKEGVANADYIVYVCYDIKYKESNVLIPAIEEYCLSISEDNTINILTEPFNDEVKEALFLNRRDCESVRNLYIKETIRRFMNAKLSCDEELLSSLVTDSSYLNINDISTKTQYIERYENLQFIIREFPETVTEADFIVYVANDVKIVNIRTVAPGLDEYMITLDEENYPKIFYGNTSADTDEYRTWSRSQDDLQTLLDDVLNRLADAMLQDADLLEFIGRIQDATDSSTEE